MKNNNDISIIIIAYKSEKIIYEFIKRIPSNIKTIIVENSNNFNLKKEVEKKYHNIKIYLRDNEGVSSSLNFAVNMIETKYFLQISPDIEFDFKDLNVFYEFANKLEDKFAALGPRFLNVKENSHKQISKDLDEDSINSIHGSCMFVKKENFNLIGRFDENIFLYFEETEYCYRAKKKGYLSYQTNKITVKTVGRSVDISENENEKISNLLIWHFIWSKFYFNKKKYGRVFTTIIFIPLLIRILFRIILYKILKKENFLNKYRFRLDGLLKSMQGKKSYLRP